MSKLFTQTDATRLLLVVNAFQNMLTPERNWLLSRLQSDHGKLLEKESKSFHFSMKRVRRKLRQKKYIKKYKNHYYRRQVKRKLNSRKETTK